MPYISAIDKPLWWSVVDKSNRIIELGKTEIKNTTVSALNFLFDSVPSTYLEKIKNCTVSPDIKIKLDAQLVEITLEITKVTGVLVDV